MLLRRLPRPELRPLLKELWFSDQAHSQTVTREHSLATGDMHLVLRLSSGPLRLFRDTSDAVGITVGQSVVGGARAEFYIKEVPQRATSVGAVLAPGASLALFSVPAGELAGRHTRLDDLWGSAADSTHSQVLEARTPQRMLDTFESVLASRLPRVRGLHPAVAMALARFHEGTAVADVVADSGYSHRRFLEVFREASGLAPKVYCRVQRFQSALRRMASPSPLTWADLALETGFSDQAHFNREFLLLAGLTPGEYRKIAPSSPNHLPLKR